MKTRSLAPLSIPLGLALVMLAAVCFFPPPRVAHAQAQVSPFTTSCTPGAIMQYPGYPSPPIPGGSYFCGSGQLANTWIQMTGTPALGVVSLSSQSVTNAGVALLNAPVGTYQFNYVLNQIGACATGTGTVVVQLTWTDDLLARASGSVTLTMTTTPNTVAPQQGSIGAYVSAGTNVSYTATYTACTTGTGTYSFRLATEKVTPLGL
jgi:hypothetical protein